MSKGKVLVAMSGGIDSTVTALMLHKQGFEVVGITMKTWDYNTSQTVGKETGCCNLDSFNDARKAAVDFGFPHYILDIREEFTESVVQNFVDEYLAGRTPNPCVLCNTHIKWKALLKRADALDCQFIATGHYANIAQTNEGQYYIQKGKDLNKDQSYVLWGLEQEVLKRTLLPLGDYTKPEIRQMALDWGYESLSKKKESYEICFVPDNNYRNFLKNKINGLSESLKGGMFVDKNGKILGTHDGYPFYTIGQRKGLVAMGRPIYVTDINPQTNTVVLGDEEDLLDNIMIVKDVNFQKYTSWNEDIEAIVKIRYNNEGTLAWISMIDSNTVKVIFREPVKSITAGQSAVFYENDDLIAGGIIK